MKERGRFFSEPIQVWHVWLCQHVQQAWANWTAKNLEDTSHCDRVTFKNLLQWVAYKVNSLQRYIPIDQLCFRWGGRWYGSLLSPSDLSLDWYYTFYLVSLRPPLSFTTLGRFVFAQSERFGALPRATWRKLIPSIVHTMEVCVSKTVMRL